jgi:hypothetical protein
MYLTPDVALSVLARSLHEGLDVSRTRRPDGGTTVTTRDPRGRLVSQAVFDADDQLVRRIDVQVTMGTYGTTTTVRTQLPAVGGWFVTEAREHEDARGRVHYSHTTSFRREASTGLTLPSARVHRPSRALEASRNAS